MKAIYIDDNNRILLDKFLKNYPYHPATNVFEWKQILNISYNAKIFFIVILDNSNNVCGLCSFYIIKDLKGNNNLYSMRYGVIIENNEAENFLLNFLNDFIIKNNIKNCLLTSGKQKFFQNLTFSTKTTLELYLDKTEEENWNKLRSKTRNMIRKSFKSNLKSEAGFQNIKAFYDIYVKNMIKKNLPIHSLNFFLNMKEFLKENVELIVAKKNNIIIGGIIILFSKNVVTYPFQSALSEYLDTSPNQFLIWETIKKCIGNKIYRLDMGESTEDGSVYNFKKNFGGIPKKIFYYNNLKKTGVNKKDFIQKNRSFSFLKLENKIRPYYPFWIQKRISLWLKKKSRLI